jgi:competence protein ComFC
MKFLSKFLQTIKNLCFFFVKYECITCEKEISVRKIICFECLKNLNIINQSSACIKCGRYCISEICIFCTHNTPHFAQAKAFCVYDETSSAIIKAFKYHKNTLAGKFIAEQTTKLLQNTFLKTESIDIITCVPMSLLKEYIKGNNHAGNLAFQIARNVQIEYNFNILKRKFRFKRQALLNKQDRAKNVAGVFYCKKKLSLAGKNILLIDDTITTSATVNECTKALLKAGASNVFVLTFAKSIADETFFQ